MKVILTPAKLIALILLFPLLLITACKRDTSGTQTFHISVPYYFSVNKARALVSIAQTGKHLSAPGKIYAYGNYLFIMEINKGIHVVDNTNPYNPHFINFINLPGNVDIAINSNILYADNYVDLLAFNISNPSHITQVKQVNDVFASLYYDKSRGLIIGYKDSVVTQSTVTSPVFFNALPYSSANTQSQSYGTGGSTARFTLMNSFLYTVDNTSLKLFDVSQANNPALVNNVDLGFGIQTIFPYQDKLFIGSTTGMQIYDATIPSAPVKLSTYQHVTSCDPVVVQGKYAYVTLHAESVCHRGTNELDILNIEDPTHPVQVSALAMLNPRGLTTAGNSLFVCEGVNGLKSFNNSDVINIGKNQLSFITGFDAEDVIVGPKSLIVAGSAGIYQYDYSNPSDMTLINRINLASQFQ